MGQLETTASEGALMDEHVEMWRCPTCDNTYVLPAGTVPICAEDDHPYPYQAGEGDSDYDCAEDCPRWNSESEECCGRPPASRNATSGERVTLEQHARVIEALADANEELVTGATYVYVPQDVPVTDAMVERARLAGERWFAEHPDGAFDDDEWRAHYRSVLKAAIEGCVD